MISINRKEKKFSNGDASVISISTLLTNKFITHITGLYQRQIDRKSDMKTAQVSHMYSIYTSHKLYVLSFKFRNTFRNRGLNNDRDYVIVYICIYIRTNRQ